MIINSKVKISKIKLYVMLVLFLISSVIALDREDYTNWNKNIKPNYLYEWETDNHFHTVKIAYHNITSKYEYEIQFLIDDFKTPIFNQNSLFHNEKRIILSDDAIFVFYRIVDFTSPEVFRAGISFYPYPYQGCYDLADDCVCGDGICSENENCDSDNCCNGIVVDFLSDDNNCNRCNFDCSKESKCENGVCTPNPICGNGVCHDAETIESCPTDCKPTPEPFDPSTIEFESECGDDLCDLDENYTVCPIDCNCPFNMELKNGICQTFCGNNVCDLDEDNENCKTDCPIKENELDYEEIISDENIDKESINNIENTNQSQDSISSNEVFLGSDKEKFETRGKLYDKTTNFCASNDECSSNYCINGHCKSPSWWEKFILWIFG